MADPGALGGGRFGAWELQPVSGWGVENIGRDGSGVPDDRSRALRAGQG